MDDLSNYFSQKDKIEMLQREVKKLKAKVLREIKNKSQISVKYHELKKLYIPAYKGNKDVAMELISQYHNAGNITLQQIAKKTRLAYSTIRGYSSEYLKGAAHEQ